MHPLKREFNVIFIINSLIYGAFVVIGYNSIDISSVFDSYKYFSAPKIDYGFCNILLNNLRVCVLMILGGLSLGIVSEVMLAYNGYVFGTIFAIGVNLYGLNKCLEATLPHSIEIIGIVLSASLGMSIAVFVIRLMFKRTDLSYITNDIRFYLSMLLLSIAIVIMAAFLESYVSIK